jgi:hydroxymethylglutaryl-CoA reductase (NADPH)
MKALFRPFALHAAYTPIETIVFFCIIGTLAYFHILHAIKHSAFLDPGRTGNVYSPPVMRPAHVLYKLGEWVGVRENTWVQSASGGAAVELQQVIYTVDGVKSKGSEVCLSFPSLVLLVLNPVPVTRRVFISSTPSLLLNSQNLTPPRYRLSLFLR